MPPAPRASATDRCKTGSGMQAGPKMTPEQQMMFLQQMSAQQFQNFQMQQAHQQRFAQTNRPSVRQMRDRYAGMLSEKEIDDAIEQQEDSGKTFRKVLLIVVLLCVALLGWAKWDLEEGGDVHPELLMLAQRDAEIRGDANSATTADGKRVKVIHDENAAELEEYYKLLNVQGRIVDEVAEDAASSDTSTTSDGEESVRKSRLQADRERRLGNKRVRDALKSSFDQHLEQYGQLVTCGRTCEAQHKQLQLAYETLNSKVDREFMGLLFDENVAVSGPRAATPQELKEAYEKKAAAIAADATASEEVKSMELAEIKDAYDIMLDPKARSYYKLTGRKPPEAMKHLSTTYGGWGQDLLLRTHKNRLILAWLDYLDGYWADYWVLFVIGFFGFLVPALVQLPRILEMAKEIEEQQYRMEQMEKQVAAGGKASDAVFEPAQ